MIEASCHCGDIKLTTTQLPDNFTSCNCSICHRLGAIWAYYSPQEVSVKVKNEHSAEYMWGDNYIKFHRCKNCGCTTHYTTTDKCEKQSVAINTRMLAINITKDTQVKYFDGADTWEYVD